MSQVELVQLVPRWNLRNPAVVVAVWGTDNTRCATLEVVIRHNLTRKSDVAFRYEYRHRYIKFE